MRYHDPTCPLARFGGNAPSPCDCGGYLRAELAAANQRMEDLLKLTTSQVNSYVEQLAAVTAERDAAEALLLRLYNTAESIGGIDWIAVRRFLSARGLLK